MKSDVAGNADSAPRHEHCRAALERAGIRQPLKAAAAPDNALPQ